MIYYRHPDIELLCGTVVIYARCLEESDKLIFNLIVEHNNEGFVYRTWERKKFIALDFDLSSFPEDEPKAVRLAEKIKRWPLDLFKAWFNNQKQLRGVI